MGVRVSITGPATHTFTLQEQFVVNVIANELAYGNMWEGGRPGSQEAQWSAPTAIVPGTVLSRGPYLDAKQYFIDLSVGTVEVEYAEDSGTTEQPATYGDYVAPSEVAMLANARATPGTMCLRTDIESENGGTLFSLTELPADNIDSWERVGTLVPETATQTSTLTASGAARSGPGYLAGLHVAAYSGGPQTVTAYDSDAASGDVLKEWTVTGVGWYPYSTAGNTRRQFDVGVYLSISGGTSRTVAALIEALD